MTSPHHTGNRPARMSTTLSPAGHHKRGDRQAICEANRRVVRQSRPQDGTGVPARRCLMVGVPCGVKLPRNVVRE